MGSKRRKEKKAMISSGERIREIIKASRKGAARYNLKIPSNMYLVFFSQRDKKWVCLCLRGGKKECSSNPEFFNLNWMREHSKVFSFPTYISRGKNRFWEVRQMRVIRMWPAPRRGRLSLKTQEGIKDFLARYKPITLELEISPLRNEKVSSRKVEEYSEMLRKYEIIPKDIGLIVREKPYHNTLVLTLELPPGRYERVDEIIYPALQKRIQFFFWGEC